MNVTILIGGKKYRLWFEAGWYRGNPFKLFCIDLVEVDKDWVSILSLQVALFSIAFGVSKVD